ncbi:MAG: DUF2695 domain-containing protein [Promethearchaeia archaeon]
MQDGKRITLSNPLLRNLRLNLRKIIDITLDKKFEDNYDKIDKIWELKREADNSENEELNNRLGILRQKNSRLDDSYKKSIVTCGLCNTLEGDRVYYKRFDEWFCPKCFAENYEHWGPSDWEPKYPLSKDQVLEFLHKLDKVVGQCETNLNLSREILTEMGISKKDQKVFLDTLYHYGGHCDCEIMLNASPKVLADFDIESK